MNGRKNYQVLDEFWLKIIAIVSMTFDHVGVFLNMYSSSFSNSATVDTISLVFRIIGRLSFPLFVFMLAEGLRHTSDKKKYLLRLLDVFVLIFVVELALYILALNGVGSLGAPFSQVFTSLVLYALFAILLEQKGWKKWLAALPVAYILLSYAADLSTLFLASGWQDYFPSFVRAQYSVFGFAIFLGFYYARPFADRFSKKAMNLTDEALADYRKDPEYQKLVNIVSATSFSLITIIFWGLSYIPLATAPYTFDVFEMGLQTYGLLSALLILCYNGRRGYDSKWFRYFNYLYYPVHIAFIALVFVLIFK